jgi:hypothetical protein
MAQFSPDTSSYDSAVYKISKFFDKYYNNDFKTNEEFINEYHDLLSQVKNASSGVISSYNPIIKGQPPTSQQMIKFAADISADSNVIAKQIDYLSAKTVSSYNLFNSEVEKESSSLERINSKIKVLQLYSRSSSDDIYYYGDSFDNSQNIDTTQTYRLPLAVTVDGFLSIPVATGVRWSPETAYVKDADSNGNVLSNGFVGNSHSVYLTNPSASVQLPSTRSEYKYYFENNNVFDIRTALRDNSPNTYFEYEKLNVSNLNGSDFDYEFKYKNAINNQNTLIPWNNADNSPLKMAVVLEKNNPYQANSVTITPFFGYDENSVSTIKVTKVEVESLESSQPSVENVLYSPVYIGSSVVPTNVTDIESYFFQKAVIKFAERKVKRITIHFEQATSFPTTIKHVYWTVSNVRQNFSFSVSDGLKLVRDNLPLDQISSNTRSVWSYNSRFNPNLILTDPSLSSITGIDNSITELISSISNTVNTKISTISSKNVSISGKKDVTFDYYIMKALDKRTNTYVYINTPEESSFGIGLQTISAEGLQNELRAKPDGSTVYSDWWPATLKLSGDPEINDNTVRFISNKDINNPEYDAILRPYATTQNYSPATPLSYYGITEEIFEWWKLKYRLTGVEKINRTHPPASPSYFLGGNYNLSEEEIIAEKKQMVLKPDLISTISLNRSYEILRDGETYNNERLQVKRWSMGIRDISVENEVYQNSAEIISKPFNFPYPIEYLMLYSDYFLPVNSQENIFEEDIQPILYYISVNDGTSWLQISPVEDPFNQSIPEIYAFNQKVSTETRIPGVAYVETEGEVNSVRVKIQLRRPSVSNVTPLVNYYEIAARVKRS